TKLFRSQGWQVLACEPSYFGCVGGGLQVASGRAAEEIDQHVVILHALLGITEDAVVDAEQFARFDNQTGFFPGLADGSVANHFSDFKNSAGNRPLPLNRRVGALD